MHAALLKEHCGRMVVSSDLLPADVGVLLARSFTLSTHSYPPYPPIATQIDVVHTKVPTVFVPR
jgi:hypothetical protein